MPILGSSNSAANKANKYMMSKNMEKMGIQLSD